MRPFVIRNTALYLRKSRADEADEHIGDTLRRHKETLLAFAAEQGLVIEDIYEEVVSGDSLYTRPQMLRLLEDVEKGRFGAVLCMDLDRLGRGGMSDQGIILETLKNADTKIITPRKTYDLRNELDEEYTEFETFLARRELKLIKRRLQRGIRKTVEDGGYLANAPYGYEKTTVQKQPSLKIREDEAAFVRLAFDLYISEKHGCQTIADELNRLGAKPRRAAAFSRSGILRILKNPVYCGKVVWNRQSRVRTGNQGGSRVVANPRENWTMVDGLHPAIIDEAVFDRAQAILQSRSQTSHFDGTVKNPLAGLLFCVKCGRPLQRRPFARRDEPDWLVCPTRGCCAASRLDIVEQAVLEIMRSRWDALHPDPTPPPQSAFDLAPAIAASKRERDRLQLQQNRLHDLLEQGIYDTDTYWSRMTELKRQETEAVNALQHLQDRQAQADKDIELSSSTPLSVSSLYALVGPSDRNRLLKAALIRGCYWKEKGWGPHQFRLFLELRPIG